MATLSIRSLPDDIHAALRVRAALRGRSMEAEARQILIQVCKPPPKPADFAQLQQWVDQMYGDKKPTQVVDTLIAERRAEAMHE
ncbi:MAG: hypothetical protein QJT81_04735 [Candidatus Thiothrix putei]|uniref:Antitoxin FitA-like ribbon-helix-helix domain-containing protein n=1 Tax=Candidatus Thiothrix putei TaxID=3080811 RepID=A0AA95KJD3_9GAMM|nr:MAG: hypothetical protein QJT81_04735 [Candidatus Thiothrix putei]